MWPNLVRNLSRKIAREKSWSEREKVRHDFWSLQYLMKWLVMRPEKNHKSYLSPQFLWIKTFIRTTNVLYQSFLSQTSYKKMKKKSKPKSRNVMSLKRFFVSYTKNKEMDGSEFFASFLSFPSFSLSKVSHSLFHHIDSNKHSGKQIEKKLCKKQSDLEWKRRKRLKGEGRKKKKRRKGKERRIGSRVWDFIPSSSSLSFPFCISILDGWRSRATDLCVSQVPMMGFMPLIIIIFVSHHEEGEEKWKLGRKEGIAKNQNKKSERERERE